MNDLSNRRFQETLNKEKKNRREWAAHSKQKQVFEPAGAEFQQLDTLCQTLEGLCAEPSRTGKTEPGKVPSRRKQLVTLRNEIRSTLKNVNDKLEEDEVEEVDPEVVKAIAAAKERLKLPPHLRGSAVLNETL